MIAVTSTPEPYKFKPFTLNIKFETKEQALRWSKMLGFNVSIPEMVFEKNPESKILTEEMRAVQTAITNYL